MTKREIMKAAHHFAKSLQGHYSARLSFALKVAYAVSKMSREDAVIYMAQNLPNVSIDSAFKILENKLVNFNASIDEYKIILRKNTYGVKESLKEMGFKFQPSTRAWIFSGNVNQVIEVSKKLAA